MKAPSDHGLLRRIVLDLFPWLRWIGIDDRKDLKIRSASGRVNIAGDDGVVAPAVHRVGDMGDGGKITVASNVLTYTAPDGTSWTITFTGPVTLALVGVVNPTKAGQVITKATTGSERVTSG